MWKCYLYALYFHIYNIMKTLLTISIALLVITLAGSGIFLIRLSNEQDPSSSLSRNDFQPSRFEVGRARFEEAMSHDLENYFPTVPADVIEIYSQIYNLIYSNMIASDELLKQLVIQQRKFFSPEMLQNNLLEEQFENLKKDLENLREHDFHYIGYRQLDVEYDPEVPTLATVDVIHFSSTQQNIRITYLLEKNLEQGRWLISSWIIQDELPEES